MPSVLEKMMEYPEICEAFELLYAGREESSCPSDPALLISTGFIPANQETQTPVSHYCILSLSSFSASPELINALMKNLKDKTVKVGDKEYTILISHRLSSEFQDLINNLLIELNTLSKSYLAAYLKEIPFTSTEDEITKNILTACSSDCDSANCVAIHDTEGYKMCAERYFVADQLKGLLLSILEDIPYIHVTSLVCTALTFNMYGEPKKLRGQYYTGVQAADLAETKASPATLPNKAEIIEVRLKASTVNESLSRASDKKYMGSDQYVTCYLPILPPCKACKINKPVVLTTSLCGLAEYGKTKNVRVTNATRALTTSTLTPHRPEPVSSFDMKRFIMESPQSDGVLIKANYEKAAIEAIAFNLLEEENEEKTARPAPSIIKVM